MTPELIASERAPGLHIAPGVEVPDDAQIAPHVTIYAGAVLGSEVRLGQGCILGRAREVDAASRSPQQPARATTVIGDGSRIGSGTIVVAGATLGARCYLGEHVMIRETAELGDEVTIGRGGGVSYHCKIGDRTRLHNDCLVGPGTVIEEDVTVAGRVSFISDPTIGRRARTSTPGGIRVRRGARIGVAAILVPPCEIGEEAFVGAGAMVRADVPPRTVVAGTPARPLRAVRGDELLEVWVADAASGD